MSKRDLILPEEILLLVLDDDTGRQKADMVSYLAAGAALAELVYQGHLKVTGEGKKARFEPTGARPEHPYLAAVYDVMEKKGFDKKPRDLVGAVGSKDKHVGILREGLAARGILEKRQRKVLFVFTDTTWPTVDPSAENALRERLGMAMFHPGDVNANDAVLITLAKQANLLNRNFDRGRLKENKDRIEAIAKGNHLAASAAREAIEAVHAAILVAVIIPVVVAS